MNQVSGATAVAANYLAAWETGDYTTMYSLLSPASRAAVDAESFTQRYRNALHTATVLTVTTRLQSALEEGDKARVAYQLTLDTALVGTLITDTVMSLSPHAGQWWVDWDAGLIWPQLTGDHYFRMEYAVPVRANMYDRGGLGLATEGTIVTVGVIPGQITDEVALLAALRTVTGLSQAEIRGRYVAAPADREVPIADISAQVTVEYNHLLSSIPGIYRDEKSHRTYPHGSGAPHVVGWVAPVPAEQLETYRAQGYRGDEWVGVAGLEAWGEKLLAGQHGGVLTIVTGTGEKVARVAERPALPSRTIHTTFDRGFQEQVQEILGGRKGAIVVLDVHSGAVRALAGGPGFDPNVFVGPVGALDRSEILADPRGPLFNRATQGTYPAASVFKIVTMAAALEEAGITPDVSFNCRGYWRLGDKLLPDWDLEGHGEITVYEGLVHSCDIVFWELGSLLHEMHPDILPRYARGFGFGSAPGLEGVLEASGAVRGPLWKLQELGEPWYVGDSTNLAIGQGYLEVTPLQVALMVAAVANGGTLYRPYVVERIGPAGDVTPGQAIRPQVWRSLPIASERLKVIQAALEGVASRGTGSDALRGLWIPVAGKTGTAETKQVNPHAWFAGYAPTVRPEIAVVVLVERGGTGSTAAAPLFRQVVEAYYGLPLP